MILALLYIVFVVSCILLIVVILLQEGKGGGLGEAFGGIAGETFGHKAGGVNKFTSFLAAAMMVSAILVHAKSGQQVGSFREGAQTPGAAPGAPPGDGVGPPPAPGDGGASRPK